MKKFLLILTYCLLISTYSFATHVFGVKMDYKCLGNSRYVVTVYSYSDCGGTAASSTMDISLNSTQCGYTNQLFTLRMVTAQSGNMVTPLCATYAGQSSCNGGSLPGDLLTVYSDTILLPQECPDWVLSCKPAPRSSYYTNLVNPASDDIYIEMTINNALGACYDSPVFRNDPMLYACAGQPFSYDMGAFDADGDSLVYSLLTPRSAPHTLATFHNGLSLSVPFSMLGGTSFVLNGATGEISFTGRGGQTQVAALGLRVDKYRGGQLLASSSIELDIQSNMSCSNAAILSKEIRGLNNGLRYNSQQAAILGCVAIDTLFFEVDVYDLKQRDSIRIDSSKTNFNSLFGQGNWSIGRSSLNGRADSARFSVAVWFANGTNFRQQLGSQIMILGLNDGACPFQSNRLIKLKLQDYFARIRLSDRLMCAAENKTIQLGITGDLSPSSIVWQAASAVAVSFVLNNSSSANASVNLSGLASGDLVQYSLSAQLGNCSVVDTVTIPVVENPTIVFRTHDVVVMMANSGSVATAVSGNLREFDYSWNTGATTDSIGSLAAGVYTLTVTDYYGCQTVDSALVDMAQAITKSGGRDWHLEVFPNPSSDRKVFVRMDSPLSRSLEMELYNSLGQLIYTQVENTSGGVFRVLLDLQKIERGAYWLKIKIGEEWRTQKIILN